MAGKKSGSDNPWAEMSRLKLDSKEAKAPAPDSPRAASIKVEEAKETLKPEVSKKDDVVTDEIEENEMAKDLGENEELETEEVEETESEVVEYSEEQLQEMSLEELQTLAEESGIDFDGMSQEELIESLLSQEAALTVENEEDEEEILLEDEEELEAEEIDGEMSLEEALALLGEDSETEEDFEETEFEEVEVEVQEGDASFELDDNNSNG